MLIKGLGAGIKGLARKRTATKVLFYASTEVEIEVFRRL